MQDLPGRSNLLVEAEKHAALGRLVAGVAHEINNPVGVGVTVATSLERRCALFAAEVARGDVKRSSLEDFLAACRNGSAQLVANLNRVAELVQAFKQVAVDRNCSDQRTFNLGDLTHQVLLSLRPSLRKRNVTLNVECQPNLLVTSYPGPYGQVLTNLVVDSVAHAFADGEGGTIDIKARACGDDRVEIVFADNGCGMGVEVKSQAFNPFFTTRRDQGGTGLGLHVVYNIVTNRLGGRLDVDSSPGQGTKFRIVLPCVAPAGTAIHAATKKVSAQGCALSRYPTTGSKRAKPLGRRREGLSLLDNVGDENPGLGVASLAAGVRRIGRKSGSHHRP